MSYPLFPGPISFLLLRRLGDVTRLYFFTHHLFRASKHLPPDLHKISGFQERTPKIWTKGHRLCWGLSIFLGYYSLSVSAVDTTLLGCCTILGLKGCSRSYAPVDLKVTSEIG